MSVLVPVYNNAATLDSLIDRLLAVLDGLGRSFEIICVDDGSRDASLSILQTRAANDSRLRVFALVRNFGSQAASCAASDLARGRRAVHIDADLENFPEDIPSLLDQLDRGYDFVCGFRENPSGRSLTRRASSFLFNMYTRRQTGISIRDVGCGLCAFESSLIRNLAAEGARLRLLTPVLLRRAQRVTEVPVRHRPRPDRGGNSFYTLLGMALDYYLFTTRRPFLISGLLSVAALTAGLTMVAAGPRLFGLMLACAGAIAVGLSLVGEYAQRVYQLAQGVPFYTLRDLDRDKPAQEPPTHPPR